MTIKIFPSRDEHGKPLQMFTYTMYNHLNFYSPERTPPRSGQIIHSIEKSNGANAAQLFTSQPINEKWFVEQFPIGASYFLELPTLFAFLDPEVLSSSSISGSGIFQKFHALKSSCSCEDMGGNISSTNA